MSEHKIEISQKEMFFQRNVLNPYPSESQSHTAYKKGFEECFNTFFAPSQPPAVKADQHYPGCGYQPLFDLMHQEHGLTLLESQMADIIHLVNKHYPPEPPAVKGAEGWIDVNHQLPEEGGRYWCYVEEINDLGIGHFQWNCAYNKNEKRFSDQYLDGGRVTHWMPLPPPPGTESPTAAGDGDPEDGPAQQAASDWVFEKNGHKWSNNSNEAGDNYSSFIAGWNAAKATAAGDEPKAEWIDCLTNHGLQFPDLSDLGKNEQGVLVNALGQHSALIFMKMFYALGLKTHIEFSAVNQGTNDLFRLRFELMQKGDGSLPAAGDGKEDTRTVFVPCDEHDPEVSGGYTSLDGRSLCYVKEVKVSDIKGGTI